MEGRTVAALLLTLGLALGLARVEGQSTCPSPDEVTSALAAQPGPADSGYVARLGVEDGALRIDSVDAAGRAVRTRRLPGSASCAELATATAVIVATWVGELRAQPAVDVHLRPRPRPSKVRWDLGAGFTAGLIGGSFSPGGILELQLAPRGFPLGARLALLGEAPRTLGVDAGSVKYARPMVELGPNVRLHPWRMLIDLHAELSLATLVLQGEGFSSTRRDFDADVGLGGGARAAIRVGPVAPFLGAQVVGWLRDQEVQVSGLNGKSSLPRYELLLSIGVAFGSFL